jgi:hypothetical protein
MSEDVVGGFDLVGAAVYWQALAPGRPETSLWHEALDFQEMRRLLLRDANPFSRIVIAETSEQMHVDLTDCDNDEVDIPFLQGLHNLIDNSLTLMQGKENRRAFEERLRVSMQSIECSLWRRMLVIAFNMLSMMSRSEALGISGKPRPVGVRHDVIPVVKRLCRPVPLS